MSIRINVTWHPTPRWPGSKPTIWQALADKLGREPTNREAADEVRRIIREAASK